jgi:hypothetical protein
VLRSWAVPKGLPEPDAPNRLAIAVPDHALDHLTYTDATKRIADTGTWELVDRTDRRAVFLLHGRAGTARYALITTGDGLLLRRVRDPA